MKGSGMHLDREIRGRLDVEDKRLDNAPVRVVTNRFSGILVELEENYGGHPRGTQLQISPRELIAYPTE